MDYSEIIINTMNSLFTNMLSSIDNTLYSLLDSIVFIDQSIINNSFFEKAFGSGYTFGLIAIANSLLFGFILYYCARLIFATYTGISLERPYQFIFKTIIFALCINNSYFISKEIIFISSLISSAIKELGLYLFGNEISFNSLIEQMNSFVYVNSSSFSIFSFDGIIKSFISVGLLNLLFTYSLRYIIVKVFVLLSPFAFLSLINQSTSWFFKTWLRNLISLLLIQSFVALVFFIIFSFDGTFSSAFSQLMYIGSIYALTKANNYIRELIGGINTDINTNISSLKSLIK